MKYKYEIFKDNFCRLVAKLIKEYRYYLIVFTILFILSFVTGIFTALKYSSDLTSDNFINHTLLDFFKKDKGIWGLFFSYYIWIFLLSIFAIFFTKNILCKLIESLAFMLFFYIIGFDLVVMFFSFGVVGIVFSIFVYGIFFIMLSLTIILILSVANKNMKHICLAVDERKVIFKLYLVLLLLQGVFLITLCILLSILHIFVIIG